MLTFDTKTTRLLDLAYQGADFTQRRRANFDALDPRPGETVLDIGCGNGMLTTELARAVGESGKVIGLDPSEDMLASARDRCDAFDWIELQTGSVAKIPLEDASVDKAVSIQVFEYLDDVPGAVAEARRVLKPGGRLVIGDMHFDSLIWHSDDPNRMADICTFWDNHLVNRALPATLPAELARQGFSHVTCTPLTVCDTTLRPDGLAQMVLVLMENYVVAKKHLTADEAAAWSAEQYQLARDQRFFFSITHFVTSGIKT